MAQYIDKDALVAEIEKSVEWFFENNDRIYDEYGNYYYKNGDNDYRFYQNFAEGGWNENRLTLSEMAEVYLDINFLEVKEVQKEPTSVWHNAKHQPKMFRKYLVRYSDGSVSGSWERHDDDFIPWKDVVKEHGFTHWCYVEDLLKL